VEGDEKIWRNILNKIFFILILIGMQNMKGKKYSRNLNLLKGFEVF